MESAKKIIPFLLVAIVFAVGGYFVGRGGFNSQSASIYGGVQYPCGDRVPCSPGTAPQIVANGTTGTVDPVSYTSEAKCKSYADTIGSDYVWKWGYCALMYKPNKDNPAGLVTRAKCYSVHGSFLESGTKPGLGVCLFAFPAVDTAGTAK